MSTKPRERRTTYLEAMESSWPNGGYLTGLMDAVSKTKRERLTVKALRLARDVIDREIAELLNKRGIIDGKILIECSHPPEHLVIHEVDGGLRTGKTYTVYDVICTCCGKELRKHTREF